MSRPFTLTKYQTKRAYAFYRKGNSLDATIDFIFSELQVSPPSKTTLSNFFKRNGMAVRGVGQPGLKGLSVLPAAAKR